jgi:hypothetical protein
MKRFLCISVILVIGVILSGSLWAADYVGSAPPGGPMIRTLYAYVTSQTVDVISYKGKIKTNVDGATVYQAYVENQDLTTDIIYLSKTDLGHWYYTVPTHSAKGFVQYSY